jgi:hypothetical protein
MNRGVTVFGSVEALGVDEWSGSLPLDGQLGVLSVRALHHAAPHRDGIRAERTSRFANHNRQDVDYDCRTHGLDGEVGETPTEALGGRTPRMTDDSGPQGFIEVCEVIGVTRARSGLYRGRAGTDVSVMVAVVGIDVVAFASRRCGSSDTMVYHSLAPSDEEAHTGDICQGITHVRRGSDYLLARLLSTPSTGDSQRK